LWSINGNDHAWGRVMQKKISSYKNGGKDHSPEKNYSKQKEHPERKAKNNLSLRFAVIFSCLDAKKPK